MLLKDKISKYKNVPLTLLIRGGNFIGIEIAKSLVDQGGLVVMADEFTHTKNSQLKELKDNELFSFVDLSGVNDLMHDLQHLDYVVFFNNDTVDEEESISTQEFLSRSKLLDSSLEIAIRHKAKFLLMTSIRGHQLILAKRDISTDLTIEDDQALGYTNIEAQRYAESLTWEYMKKSNLDGRIIRLGEVVGEGMNLDSGTIFTRYVKDAVDGKKIIVYGDGLERLYFVHLIDAAYGLIKALFSKDARGQIFSLHLDEDITILSLAYKIQDLAPNAKPIEFKDVPYSRELNIYKPAKNINMIGWKPKISFERAVAQTIDYYYDLKHGVAEKNKPPDEKYQVKEELINPPVEELKKPKPVRTKGGLKDKLVNFFFETTIEENPGTSVLDNLMHTEEKVQSSKNTQGKIDSVKPTKIRALNRVSWTGRTVAGYIVILILGLFLYISIVLPSIRLVYHSYLGYKEVNALNSASIDEMGSSTIYAGRAKEHFEAGSINIAQVRWLLNIVISRERTVHLQNIYDEYAIFLAQIEQSDQAITPISQFQQGFSMPFSMDDKNNLVIRESHDNTNIVNQLDDHYAETKTFLDEMNDSYRTINSTNISLPWISSQHETMKSVVRSYYEKYGSLNEYFTVLPAFIGAGEKDHTVLILFYDEEKTYLESSSFLLIRWEKGNVVDLKQGSFLSIKPVLSASEKKYVIDKLNPGEKEVKEDSITFLNIASLKDDNFFYNIINATIGFKADSIESFIFLKSSAIKNYDKSIDDIGVEDDQQLVLTNQSLLSKFTISLLSESIENPDTFTKFIVSEFASNNIYVQTSVDWKSQNQ